MSSLLPFYAPIGLEAGLDEAGRGCLAGPVVAAAVILPRDFHHPFLTDSKQMTLRQFLFDNFGWDIYEWSPDEIRF